MQRNTMRLWLKFDGSQIWQLPTGLGLVIENESITVKTVMHRREIYKFFP